MDRASSWDRVGVRVVGLFVVALTVVPAAPALALAQESASSEARRRSPALAFALGVVVPGAGQAYNGDWGKAAVVVGSVITGVGLFGNDGATCLWDDDGENCQRAAIGLALTGLVLVYSWIDAPLTARSMNRRIDLGEVTAEFGPGLWPASGRTRHWYDLPLMRLRF